MASGVKTDTVDLLTTEMAARYKAQENALVNGTVSEEAIDKFDQAREKDTNGKYIYLTKSYNNFVTLTTNDASKDDAVIGDQQVNSFLSGNQQAYLQRRRTRLSRLLDNETINAQNISENGVITAQLKNVGVIMDAFYKTEQLKVTQEGTS